MRVVFFLPDTGRKALSDMRKFVKYAVCLLAFIMLFAACFCGAEDGFAGAAFKRVSEILQASGISMDAAKSMYEGSADEYNSGVCFYFDTNRVYVYGENADGDFEQYLFIALDQENMAACIPVLCTEWDEFSEMAGDRPFMLTVGIDNVYYYAKTAEEAKQMARSFNLLLGTDGYAYVTVTKAANIREAPGMESRRIGYVEAGTELVAVDAVQDKDNLTWYKIEYGDGYGYLSASLTVSGDK